MNASAKPGNNGKPSIPFFAVRARMHEYYRQLMETPGRIEQVAGGFALGVFFALSPWHGFQLLITLAFCALFRLSLAAGATGTMVFNIFVAMLILPIELEVGRLVLNSGPMHLPHGMKFNLEGVRKLLDTGLEILLPWFVGSVIVGGSIATLSYFWLRGALRTYRKRIYLRRHHGPDA